MAKKAAKIHVLTHLETGTVYQFHPNARRCVVKLTANKRLTTHSLDTAEARFLYKHLRSEGYVKV